MNRVVSSIFVLVLLTTSVLPPVTTANEPPLVDAGLDQHVTRGATVLLDATGSRDSDGHIERYNWSIVTPSGRTITPDSPSRPRTQFYPNSVGTYTVSVTATDEDGGSSHDFLYVRVSPGEKPTVDVSGSRTLRVGQQAVYSATVDAGSASLDHVVWSLDGKTIATDSLSGTNDVVTITRTFPNTGTRTITATVFDSDKQTDSDTLDISVRANRNPPTLDSLADDYDPTISGNELITGASPLRGTYELRSTPTSEQVRSVKWLGDGALLGGGRTLTTDWNPGDHSLYAVVTYSDDSRDIARFSSGSTTVVADPKPTVELPSLDSYGAVSGRAIATDSYENLQSVSVRLGGEEIGRTRMDATSPGKMQYQRTISFDSHDFVAGKEYSLTVTAVDVRGQKSTLKRTITPAKLPEIVQSGFVNNDVDSYDTRIDPKRYTAHHVTKIDLNGVDPDDVDIRYVRKKSSHDMMKLNQNIDVRNGVLSVDSYWAGTTPDTYRIIQTIEVKNNKYGNLEWSNGNKYSFQTHPSPPEIRLDVINDGTTGYRPNDWGIVVDASDSFDPDGSELKFIWKEGAKPITPDNETAKFRSVEFAELEVRDEYGLSTSKSFEFLDYFAPDVNNVSVISEGPYRSDDTVRLRVTTEQYKFTKNSYHLQYGLGLSIDGASGSVVDWEQHAITKKQLSENHHLVDPRYYTGIVEIPASELFQRTDRVKLRVYNKNNPGTYKEVGIPEVEIHRRYGTVWSNPRIKSTEYLVKRPTYDWKLATSPTERDQLLSNGYSVDEKTREGFEYTLEKRVKVRDAKYEHVDRTFSTKLEKSAFLQGHPDWWSTGRKAEKYSYTTTEHDWRDSKSGKGSFTGETRRVQTHPARYRTMKQYVHEYDVEKTGTRTVKKRKRVRVTKTDTKYVMQCSRYGICFEVPEEYTYTTTVTRTYITTEEYTYTVTQTDTYWAYQKFSYDAWYTGNRKRVKVQDAEYETQYRFEYTERHSDVNYTYGVQTREKVRDAQYEWRQQSTTTKRDVVMSRTMSDDWRIGSYRSNVKWSLKKRTGTKTATVDQYLETDTVVMTYVTAKVDLVRQFVMQNGEFKNETIGDKIVEESYQNIVSNVELRNRLENHNDKPKNSCKRKTNCII